MFVVNNRKIFFSISLVLVLASFGVLFAWGLPLGIDFTGGSVLEMKFVDDRPDIVEVENIINALGIENVSVRETNQDGYIIRTPFLEDAERERLVTELGGETERFSSVGPTIGAELRQKALIAIAAVVVLIVAYIAFVFRRVSDSLTGRATGPASWKYGVTAIIALIHDIIIPTGIVVVLGHFGNATADSLFVMALLAILGLSVNDTIVVFDRIRENLSINSNDGKNESFSETVGKGLSQTYARSINTSITTLFVLLALFFIGGPTVHNFVLTLIVGVIAGTYSSIFLASPMLVVFASKRK